MIVRQSTDKIGKRESNSYKNLRNKLIDFKMKLNEHEAVRRCQDLEKIHWKEAFRRSDRKTKKK